MRFYKSLKSLSVTVKTTNITIKAIQDKILINNNYIPITINLLENNNNVFYNKIKSYISK